MPSHFMDFPKVGRYVFLNIFITKYKAVNILKNLNIKILNFKQENHHIKNPLRRNRFCQGRQRI